MSLAEIEAREVQLEPGGGGLWRDAWSRLRRNPGALVGFALVGLFVVVALFAPLIAPEDPRDGVLSRLAGSCCPGPSAEHWFGVDQQGRDELSRIVYGARFSLLIGVVSVAVGLSIGMVLGSIAGYVGGFVDCVIMRLMDIMLSIPGLLLAIGIVAMLGPGLFQIMIAVGVTQVPIFARLMRGSILAQRDNDFVLAARSIGVPRRSILASHILPNAISPVIVQGTLALATAIIDVAGLGFLGLGPQDPSTPEWGTMLTDTTRYLQTAPHLAIIPGVAIIISVLGFNLIGDGLREALDPEAERPWLESLFSLSTTCTSASAPSGGSSTRSTGSRSTSPPARRSGSWASRAAARASPRSPCSGSSRGTAASRRAPRCSATATCSR